MLPGISLSRYLRALGLGVALMTAIGACSSPAQTAGPSGATPSGPAASGQTTSSPTASGTATCATAPSVPDDLEGWGPPAEAPEIFPTIISVPGQLACGPTRLLFTIVGKDLRPIGAPDRSVKVELYNLGRDPKTPIASLNGTFIWAIEGERGIYYANTTFPEAGRYGAAFTTAGPGGGPETQRLTFDVQASSPVIKVGDRAPASKTPTLADVGGDLTHVSTDDTPDPRLYATSLDAAIAAHKPVALLFATPKFCTSAQCGPTLDRFKPFVDRYPTITFINVEPYQLDLVNGSLQPVLDAQGAPALAPVSEDFHLLVEPTVYVIDRDGIVTANFDLIFSDEELTAALDAVK